MTRGRHLFIYDAYFMQLLVTRWQPSMTSLTCPPAIFVFYLYSKLNFILSISQDKHVFQCKIAKNVLSNSLKICSGYSKEPTTYLFLLRNKKINFLVCTLNVTVLLITQNLLKLMGKKIFTILRSNICLAKPMLVDKKIVEIFAKHILSNNQNFPKLCMIGQVM